jgi:hypothetical protein
MLTTSHGHIIPQSRAHFFPNTDVQFARPARGWAAARPVFCPRLATPRRVMPDTAKKQLWVDMPRGLAVYFIR